MAGVSNPGVEHDAKTRGIILHIVEQIKSQGVFDRFRRDCLEELDSKEPYRQLKQRVESHVATFLSKQTFSANLPKNQLRTSLRANINQSEVLSKGVDRLLEQVLVEKSSSFYKEIENLVEEHLISTGHYTRYDRDKSQRSDAQPRSELTKLSDKEVEDIIKEETNKFLEASADERSQESERGSYADTPPPGTSGEVTEVETLINVTNDKESAKSSQGLNTNLEASSAPDSSTGKLGVEMPASEESGLKGETEVIRKLDESIVSKAQNVDDLSQTDGSKDHESSLQETNALISETENPGSAKIAKEASEIIQEPVVITEASTVSASTTRETNLFFPNESSTSNQGTSASQGKVDMTMSEITKSDDSAPDSEANQPTDATVVQASISQYDIAKGGELNVDLPAVQIGIERKESKAETEKENTATEPTPTTEIKQAKISKSRADNPEVVKPKAEKVKTEVPKSGEAKPEIFQPEIVKPEVGKPKVDKTRRPEEDMKVVKPEITKPKVNKVPSKPAVGKTKVSKPEVSKVELFSPDVITAKVVKAPKLEEKVKTRTKTEKQRSKKSIKPKTKEQISMSKLFSTDEETDEDLGIPSGKISANKSKKSKPEVLEADNADFSDSDITVSSVHTSDLSSLEDSMSDMEYEDYQELVLKKGKGKESGAGGSTKSGGESGASGIETVDKKKINPGTLDSGGGKIENVDTKKKKSVESGADVKEEIKEKGSKEISQGERSGESGTSVCEDTDSKSRNLISTRIDTKEQNKEKMFDESGAASPKVDDESGDSVEKSDSKEKKPYHSDISSDEEQNNKNDEKDLQQKTKARRSDFTESEAKTASQGKEQANLHPSKSDPALFKPIEPAEPQVFSEPAAKRRGEPAFAQATDGASDADNETTIEDSDGGNTKLGKRRHSRRASTSQESESSNDTTTPIEEQKEPQAQRRSARVASKDRTRSTDEKDDHGQANAQKSEEGDGDSARKLRRTRYSQEKHQEVKTSRSKEEKRNEKAEKRTSRLASDSTDSDMKPSKRSKRTVKPTRCYSPSENS